MTEGNTVNDIIAPKDDEEILIPQSNTMQDSVKELEETLHKKFPNRHSLLSYENIDGMTQVDTLNEYMDINFGYRFRVLDKLCVSKCERVVSKDGFGIASSIEIVKAIQATFEQHQLGDTGLRGLISRR